MLTKKKSGGTKYNRILTKIRPEDVFESRFFTFSQLIKLIQDLVVKRRFLNDQTSTRINTYNTTPTIKEP